MDIPLLNGRLKEFFAHGVAWHRRLWSVGTILGLREVGEYADACLNEDVASTEGLRYVIEASRRAVGRDPGVAHLAVELDRLLDLLSVPSRTKIPRDARAELSELTRRAHDGYCGHWSGSPEVSLEFAARSLAAHLLDSGFSADHLFRWLTARESSLASLDDLAEETQRMVTDMPERPHEIFVPCAAPFDKSSGGSGTVRWMDGHEASAWLKSQLTVPETRRHNGGFLLTITARDPWAAIDAARALIARADARVKVAQPSNDSIVLNGWARISGNTRDFEIRLSSRQVEIGSLDRQGAVYRFDDGLTTQIDDALELASYMESPSTGAAITGGWAAIEGLLIRPGESGHHMAADRMAALVACSWPRAELTPLAYSHLANASDSLARELRAAKTNHEKVLLLERHLASGGRLELKSPSDRAAEDRIVAVIGDPARQLSRIRACVTESLRRLYNQRNTIAHSGSLRSVAIDATVRTSLSLVGAGLDRVVHAQLESAGALNPLGLVARAETELRLVGGTGGRALGSLLD